jgi:16S rRNA (cytosine967-C5)-methyltransferase
MITLFSKIEEGNKVLETCAGNGGKTAHLVDLIPNIDITAFDIHENKLNNLTTRMARLGKRSVRTLVNTPENQEKVKQKMDVIYMDMPCTGSGTIKRQPDLKYKINQKSLDEKIALQRAIFNDFSPMLKDNGRIIYSTCSILEAENERQIEWIEKKGYHCSRMLNLDPAKYPGDGFFMAEIIKKV